MAVVSVAHLSIASSGEDQVGWEPLRWRISDQKGPSGGQRQRGACRREGLVAGEHGPDRLGQAAGDVDLGDLGAALAAEAVLGVLVAIAVDLTAAGVG
jgi:hypothetical protein